MKLIRFFIISIEILLLYVVQNICSINLPAGNIIPDMLMVIVCGTAYMFGSTSGTVYGFMSGLLIDISAGSSLGFAAFIFALTGFLAGFARKFYSRSNYVIPLAMTAAGEFVYLTLYYVANFILKGRHDYPLMVKSIIMPRVTFTLLIGCFLYKLCQLSVDFTRVGEK
jgi:rod shape-determining protein MreD